ncbi:MAG TPA: helix-turn-helix domain-containing protein [Streptosporangiaceae bacterium]
MADQSIDTLAGADPGRIATQQDFGRELTAARTAAGLTVRQVARATSLPISTTGDYFSGRHLPASGQADQLLRILRACGVTEQDALQSWTDALLRARRPRGRRAGSDVPYRGLARYEAEDARWFFGREDIADQLAALATSDGSGEPGAAARLPLMLVGPSGSGKSSLLRAGLIPRLADDAVVVEPGADPVTGLQAALGDQPVLIVDQFEAVFTRCHDEAKQDAFVAEICAQASHRVVVLALRADYYQQALRYPLLATALQSRQVVLGPMTAEQIGRAVTEPARLARLDVEDGLVRLLLRDLAGADRAGGEDTAAQQPVALPLLSHAMLSTYQHSHGSVLTIADYVASGGIRDALIQTAESVYRGLDAAEQQLARRLFLHLVHVVADDTPRARAVESLSELRGWGGALAEQVLGRFVDERLITVDADTAQITHDALLTAWPRLRSWIDTGMADLRTRRRILEGARAWQESGRESAALWRGSQLVIARDWAADEDNRASLSPVASDFVAAAVAEEQARLRTERNRTRRLRRMVAALTVLVLAVVGLAGYAFEQRHTAAVASDDANSREIALEAGQVRGQNAPLAAQLSVAAYGLARTPQAMASLLDSTGSPSAARLIDSPGVVESVSLDSDHKLLAVVTADGTLRLWDVARPSHPVPVGSPLLADAASPLYAVAFSPDGTTLAAAGAGRTVSLWNVADPARPVRLGHPLRGARNTIYSVAFSPDGKLLAAGSADKTVRLWDVADPAHATALGQPLAGPAGFVQSVAFSPDGKLLAAGSTDKTVRLWDVADPARPVAVGRPLTGPAAMVTSLTFSPDGGLLAAGSQDDKVWLWRIAAGRTATPDGSLTGATNWVNAVAFSPDGGRLAAGTADASVLVWNVRTMALAATLPQAQPVTSLAFDGQGRLAAGSADGTVSVWTLPTPVLVTGKLATSVAYSPDGRQLAVGGYGVQTWNAAKRSLIASQPAPAGSYVNGLAYAPRGGMLAAAYSDQSVQLWRTSDGLQPLGMPFKVTASGNAESVAFSPDGSLLATAGDDGTVRLFSLADPAHPRQLASVHDSGTYVYSVAFAPDGKVLAATSTDDLTRLWNVADPARPRMIGRPLAGPASYAITAAFSPDGSLLAVSSADKSVWLWNVRDPAHPVRVGAPLTGPTSYVWGLAFSPSGKTLAAGVTDGTVWLWNLADPASPALVATLTGPAGHVYSVAFSPSGRVLAAASDDGTVHLWDTSATQARAAVCSDAGQPLTRKEWSTYVPGVPYRAPCT